MRRTSSRGCARARAGPAPGAATPAATTPSTSARSCRERSQLLSLSPWPGKGCNHNPLVPPTKTLCTLVYLQLQVGVSLKDPVHHRCC